MNHTNKAKDYQKKWLDAERSLIIRGFPLQSTRPNITRVQINKLPVTSQSLWEKQELLR